VKEGEWSVDGVWETTSQLSSMIILLSLESHNIKDNLHFKSSTAKRYLIHPFKTISFANRNKTSFLLDKTKFFELSLFADLFLNFYIQNGKCQKFWDENRRGIYSSPE